MRKKKLEYGDGSVYQRADGMWVAKYRISGKAKYLYSKTEKGARQKLNDLKSSPKILAYTSPGNILLTEYITMWFQSYKDIKVKRGCDTILQV